MSLIHVLPMCTFKLQVFAIINIIFLVILLLLVYFHFYNYTGCYGINDEDSDSGRSNDTDSPTELWFCDACKVGVQPVSLFIQT